MPSDMDLQINFPKKNMDLFPVVPVPCPPILVESAARALEEKGALPAGPTPSRAPRVEGRLRAAWGGVGGLVLVAPPSNAAPSGLGVSENPSWVPGAPAGFSTVKPPPTRACPGHAVDPRWPQIPLPLGFQVACV